MTTRLLETLRRLPLGTSVVLFVAFGAVAWPLLTAHVLPFVDYPEHLSTIATLHGQDDPRWARFFTVELARTQYLGFYLLSHLAAYPLGVEAGTRLVTVLGLASLPLAVAAFLRAHGRPAILGALAAPVALNAFAFWGFLNYCSAIPLALLALAVQARALQKPSWKPLLAYGALTVATFYMHAQVYAWLALASGVQALAMLPVLGWRRVWQGTWRSVLAAVPSGIAVLVWLRNSAVLDKGMDGGRAGVATAVAQGKAEFQPVADALHEVQAHAFDVYRGHADDHLAVAFGFLVLLAIALRGVLRAPETETETVTESESTAPPPSLAPEALLALTVALYLFAPTSYKLIAPINHRFLPIALALLPVLGPLHLPRTRPVWLLGLGLLALSVQTARVHATELGHLSGELGELDEALRHTPPGQRLLGLIFDRDSAFTNMPTWLHAHQYYQARVGGSASFGFAEFTISPVRYKPGTEPPPFPPRFEWTPERFEYPKYRGYFDLYLIRRAPGDQPAGMEAARKVLETRQVDLEQRVDLGFYQGPLREAPRLVFDGPRWTVWTRAQAVAPKRP
jgi:hypothetical protein